MAGRIHVRDVVGLGPTGAAAPPAPFRAEDGEVIETAEAGLVQGNAEYELGVRPLYRGGAYLVGIFDIRHMDTGGTVPAVLRPLNSRDYPGGRFTAFSPTTGGDEDVRYRAVRAGAWPTEDLERAQYLSTPQWPVQPLETGHTERVFVYFPAPPTETDSVTPHAADFGTFEVPVDQPVAQGPSTAGSRRTRRWRLPPCSVAAGVCQDPGRDPPAADHGFPERGGVVVVS
jgi:hypothetical protein